MNIEELIKNPRKLEDVFGRAINTENKELANLLVSYIKDPDLIYDYAYFLVKGKVSDELENIIAQDARVSARYAYHILKEPFSKGEDKIATEDPEIAFWYAKNVLKGPFGKGEDMIAQDDKYAYLYAKDILKDRFKKGEDVIVNFGSYLKLYKNFLKKINKLDEFLKDYPETEKIIKEVEKEVKNEYRRINKKSS
jgi:hypothetical protein